MAQELNLLLVLVCVINKNDMKVCCRCGDAGDKEDMAECGVGHYVCDGCYSGICPICQRKRLNKQKSPQ